MLDETTTEESTEESESTTSTEESAENSSTSETSEEKEDESQETETETETESETTESSNPILTDEEKARRQELLGSTDKEVRDLKSEHGRERKAWEDERREYLALLKAKENIDSGDTSTTDDGEPEYYQPSQPFKNEDGTINMDALAEWNLHTNQKLFHELQKAQKQIEDLGGDVTGIHQTAAEAKQAQEFKQRYGLSDEVFSNYQTIKQERGELDAIDYLNIERKEAEGIAAAQAHRDQQRTNNGGAPALNTGGAMTQTTQDSASIAEQAAKEILAMPRGDDRNDAVMDVPFKYPQEVSSQILKLVVDGS